jgi:cytochrome c-type biogenesis protein
VLLGIAFAFGWTLCIGPILAAILAVSASAPGSGTALLSIYSLGLGLRFLAVALFTDWSLHHIRRIRHYGPILHMIAGILLISTGLLMVTGLMTRLSIWMLDAMPWLGTLG